MASSPRHLLYRYAPLGMTLGLGIGLSIVAASLVSKWEAFNHQVRFQRQIENLTTGLQRSLNRYTDVLLSLSDYYAVADLQVDRQDFAQFVQRSLASYPGIQALEWAPVVSRSERSAFEQQMRSSEFNHFQITELAGGVLVRAGDRSRYVPVTYVEPLRGNEAALGYDLASDPVRVLAIEIAAETGEITATGRIRLVQEQRDQFGFLVFLPLYQSPAEGDRAGDVPVATERTVEGFLLGVFRVSDVVEEALRGVNTEIDFAIYDQNAKLTDQFLGVYESSRKQVMTTEKALPATSLCAAPADCVRTLTVGQRQWQIQFSPSSGFSSNPGYWSIAALILGLLLTASLVLFLSMLQAEADRTRELSQLKLHLFSMASHELRVPLSTILLSSESLEINQQELTEEQKQNNLKRIQLAAKRMSQLISDILTLSRAEAGKLDFQPELLNLESFCQQIVEEMQMSANQEIIFICSCSNTMAYLDKNLLRSLLSNLLSNAIKYSPEASSIQFNVRCHDNAATFEIIDRGIGIPKTDQPKLYEAFHRGQNVGQISGTGLGLAVVKTCVDLHQGQIAIESTEQQGTIVTVTLPLE
jgi:signal transduction histidine kinase